MLAWLARADVPLSSVPGYFANFGGVASNLVLETSQTLGWLRALEGGLARVTARGRAIQASDVYEVRLRLALIDFVNIKRPAWLQNATFGRARVLAFAGSEIRQVFVEAELARGDQPDVVAFWDQMAALARGQLNDRLLATGREGERLTLDFEAARTGRTPRWISIEDNADGYDVLSIVDKSDTRSLSIEVKASTQGTAASFHLTRNEWNRAMDASCHRFDLWSLASGRSVELASISPDEMRPHIPADQGKGEWTTTEIRFVAFSTRFAPIDPSPRHGRSQRSKGQLGG